MSRWWKHDEPTPPLCRNCGHGAEYHTPNIHGVLVCVAPVNARMECRCHEAGGYQRAEAGKGEK